MVLCISTSRLSDRDSMAASVSTRVVSWTEAAESDESVASEALVMPIISGRPSAGFWEAEDLSGLLAADRRRLVALAEPLGDVVVVGLGAPVVHRLVVGGRRLDVLVAGAAGAGRDQ